MGFTLPRPILGARPSHAHGPLMRTGRVPTGGPVPWCAWFRYVVSGKIGMASSRAASCVFARAGPRRGARWLACAPGWVPKRKRATTNALRAFRSAPDVAYKTPKLTCLIPQESEKSTLKFRRNLKFSPAQPYGFAGANAYPFPFSVPNATTLGSGLSTLTAAPSHVTSIAVPARTLHGPPRQ